MLPKQIDNHLKGVDLSKATTLDRIYAWYIDETSVDLSSKEHNLVHRYKEAFHLMLEGKPDHEIVEDLHRNFGMSERQGYRDLNDARKLYGDINKSSKEAERYILKQYLLEHRKLALAAKNIQEANKAVAIWAKIKGLDKADPDLPTPETFQPHTYIIQINAGGNTVSKTINIDAIQKLDPSQFEELLDQVQQTDIDDLHLLKLLDDSRRSEEDDTVQ
jgi:hypothetical protein